MLHADSILRPRTPRLSVPSDVLRLIAIASLAASAAACSSEDDTSWNAKPGQNDAGADAQPDSVPSDVTASEPSEADAGIDSATDDSSIPDASVPDTTEPDAEPVDTATCLPSMQACSGADSCCDGRTCGTTTLGQVCCGNEGIACATSDGADCCGDLLCVDKRCQKGEAMFKAPYGCGQSWTYDHHSAEVREALDFIRDDGGQTNGAPVLASAEGVATQHSQPSGAGNYIVITHSGGWQTYYFHLSSFSVADGTHVMQGQAIGLTGTTGASSGPHIHYEQLLNGVGQKIKINGVSLEPYPSYYNEKSLVSDNGCSGEGKPYMTWGSNRPVHAEANLSSPVVGTLPGPTLVYVVCQKQGESVTAEGYTNDWWSKLSDPSGYISNIYIDDPASKLPGVPDC